ncbi:MAG: DUF378 domain-containing protein [Nanoarchaeota archaeon]|nr:DUF378 domain-containing protein [Nanoarchaeota archaeon]MBU1704685.1 DUF378 domain-containing protein [Nanoarchaeota archaeon]
MANTDTIDLVAKILLIIGGLNWGLFIFGVNLVTIISFGVDIVAKIVYGLVAVAAIIALVKLFKK